jgi:hypothetical protein
MSRSAKSILKRARGDVHVHKEIAVLRDDLIRAVRQMSTSKEAKARSREIAALRSEMASVSRSTDAVLRALGGRLGPYDLARPAIKQRFEPPTPWMVPEAVEHVNSLLTADMIGVEWGGGASTPYWCERLGVLHTFEADRGFALLLLDYMTRRVELADRWRLHFVGCNWPSTADDVRRKGLPLPTSDVKERLVADYVALLPGAVDAVFVDGSVREATLTAMAGYVARDRPRVVVVDNTDAAYVSAALDPIDMSAYDRTDHAAAEVDPTGKEATCTTVFARRD